MVYFREYRFTWLERISGISDILSPLLVGYNDGLLHSDIVISVQLSGITHLKPVV
jgi:hypothetical protein